MALHARDEAGGGKRAGMVATRVYAVPGAFLVLFIVAISDARHHKLNGTGTRSG